MKKTLSIVLICSLLLTMAAGCGKSSDSSASKDKEKVDSNLSYNPDDYVTLGEYKGLEGYDITCEVSDEEVQEEIDSVLQENATYTDITNRGAKNSDYITFDYEASVDGEKVEDCAESDYEIQLGYGEFNDTIEEKLIGAKVDDVITVETTIPDDLSSTNSGDKGTFTITIKKLQKENIPEYNLDYVKENTDFDTIEDYEADVKEDLLATKEEDTYSSTIYDLVDAAINASTFKEDYPEELYTSCEDEFYESASYYADMFGIEAEEYLSEFAGYEEDDIKNEILSSVHERLVIYAIAQKENLFLTDEEYDSYVEALASEYGYNSASELEEEYGKETVMYAAVYDNVSSLLYENATLTTISEEEYEELNASEDAEEADAADEEEVDTEDSSEEE